MSPIGKVFALSMAGKDGPETLVVPGGWYMIGFQCLWQTIYSRLFYMCSTCCYICSFRCVMCVYAHIYQQTCSANHPMYKFIQIQNTYIEIEVNECMFMLLCLPVHGVAPPKALTSSWRSPRSIWPFSLGSSSINRVESWDIYSFSIRVSNCNCGGMFS